jgi:hypothetical protein
MKFSAVFAKVVPSRNKKETAEDSKPDDEMATPPPIDGLVKLQTTRLHEDDSTLTSRLTKPPPGSRSASAPASIGASPPPESSIDITQRPNSSSGHHRPLRRAKTVELVPNKAYRPTGGPEYIRVLAKYKLLKEDKHQGLIVARFVNAGSRKFRKPEIIKVDQFSANGNQEFLADVTIGTASHEQQSMPVSFRNG